MADKKTVWVLTSEVNAYDQHGAYFEAVWLAKPTQESLAKVLPANQGLQLVEHVLAGGGRRGVENAWFNLEEVEVCDG